MARGDLFAEIWSRPGSAVFERLVSNIPGPYNFTKRMASGVGQGDITVPADWDRIGDVIHRVPGAPAADVRTLVRVFQEQDSGPAQVVYEYFLDLTGDEAQETTLKIQGPGVESLMSDAMVEAWDWDGNSESDSTLADWIWGGKDIVGPVEVSFIPHVFEVVVIGTGGAISGTLDISVSANGGAYQDATIDWNDSAFDVEQAIEALPNVTTVSVEGSGTELNPWKIGIEAPSAEYTVAVDGSGLTNAVARITLTQFGKLMPVGWTESRVGQTTIPHGILTGSGITASLGGGSDPTLPAGCSAWIRFDGTEYLFPGVQKIVRVIPSGVYQVTSDMILYAQGANADVRVIIRDLNEQEIAKEEITLVSNTATPITGFTVNIPDGITEVVFRIGHIGTGDPPPIYIACPNMHEGLAPTTAGGIMDALFDDATVNHVGDGRVVWEDLASPGTSYIDLTFTSVLDSAGVAWDDPELTFTAQRGKTYLQVLTDLNHLGYRWSVTPTTPGRWSLNLYNPSWVAVDATALDSPAINLGSGVTSGPIYRSHLTGNAVTVEGAQMQFGRSTSAASIAAIGRREVYQPDRSLLTNAMATLRAAEEVTSRLLSGLSVSVSVDPVNGPVPLLDYDVDWQLNVQVPPVLTKSGHRVAAVTVAAGDVTTYKLAFSSEAFAGVQGALEAVRRLMLKFEGLEQLQQLEAMGPGPAPDTPIIVTGSAPTIVIAASDSSAYSRAKADTGFLCDGVADNVEIQNAVNLLSQTGGEIILCEGHYYFDDEVSLTGSSAVGKTITFRGLGTTILVLNYDGVLLTTWAPLFNIGSSGGGVQDVRHMWRFQNIEFDGAEKTYGIAITYANDATADSPVFVENCTFRRWRGACISWTSTTSGGWVVDSTFLNNTMTDIISGVGDGTGAIFVIDVAGRLVITGNDFTGGAGDILDRSAFNGTEEVLIFGNNFDGTMTIDVSDTSRYGNVKIFHNWYNGSYVAGDHDGLTSGSSFTAGGSVVYSGDITPAQITASQNDYNPTGLSTASTLRLSSDAAWSITGLAGGTDGRILIVHNVGSFNITLEDEDAGSAAANRFAFTADLVLAPDDSATLQYDSTSSRWRLASGAPGAGVSDHGALTGLADDDHTQYLLAAGTRVATYLEVDGLTGATTNTRYVGGTATGAPASGTFAIGDYVITQDGNIYVCTAAGSPGTWAAVGAAAATDAAAIHDNVAGEISAVTSKATPVDGDFLLIEDSEAANVKKKITIGDLPGSAAAHDHTTADGSGVLTNDEHDGYAEFTEIASPATPAANKVRVYAKDDGGVSKLFYKGDGGTEVGPLGAAGSGTDADAIHDNVAAEISAITEKTSPVAADLLLIEDSAAANAKKKIQIGNLPGGLPTPGTFDDFFDNASLSGDWTAVLPSGSHTITEADDPLGVGRLSVVYSGQAASDLAGIVKTLTGITTGDYIQAGIRMLGYDANYSMAALVLSDGTATTANIIAVYLQIQGGSQNIVVTRGGTFDAVGADIQIAAANAWNLSVTTPEIHVRLTYQAANTFRVEFSPDGISWIQRLSDTSRTITPTHGGLGWTVWGGANPAVNTYTYFKTNV